MVRNHIKSLCNTRPSRGELLLQLNNSLPHPPPPDLPRTLDNNLIYRIWHLLFFIIVLFSTARTASVNTSPKFNFLIAAHSTNAKARILVFIFLPSAEVTNFGESGMRKSALVPGRRKRFTLNKRKIGI